MQQDFAIVIAIVALVALAALVLLRRRARLSVLASPDTPRWEPYAGDVESLSVALSGMTLMQLGYSRRITAASQASDSTCRIAYRFETGMEHFRATHRWTILARRVAPLEIRGIATTQDWLYSAAWSSHYRSYTLPLQPANGKRPASLQILLDDADRGVAMLDGPLGEFLSAQPRKRSWEFLPEYVVCYHPGRASAQDLPAMTESLDRCIAILQAAARDEDGRRAAERPLVVGAKPDR